MKNENILILNNNGVLCATGDGHLDLYLVKSGKLLVCVLNGTEVIPLAFIGENEFVGELSYFDHRPRSACIVAVEKTVLVRIPKDLIDQTFPKWLNVLGHYMTLRLRKLDKIVQKTGLKKGKNHKIQALSIEDQRKYFKIIQDYKDQRQNESA